MAFTPRADEVAAVVAILTAVGPDGEPIYQDEAAMGKAIVRAVAGKLVERDLYAILPASQPWVAWGPYWTRTEAENAWKDKGIGAAEGGRATLLRVFPWNPVDTAPKEPTCTCGHHRDNHVNVRRRTTVTYKQCGRCDRCSAFQPKG